jgi:hypothetical protein
MVGSTSGCFSNTTDPVSLLANDSPRKRMLMYAPKTPAAEIVTNNSICVVAPTVQNP